MAGGRYDGLVEMLGGQKTPGIGWASGVDRLADLIATLPQTDNQKNPISIIALGDKALNQGLKIASHIRSQNKYCEVFLSGNFKKKLERANKLKTSKAILIFEQDNGQFEYKIKDFTTGDETVSTLADCMKI